MKASFQIQIPKRMAACCVCEKPFENMQEIVSELMEDKKKEFYRKDSCLNCHSSSPQAITWKQKYQQKVTLEPEDLDEVSRAWDLLQTLSSGQKKEELEEAFILTLYLIRKKILAKRGKTGLYEHLETGEMVMLADTDLKKLSIQDIHLRLQEKLK